MNKKLLLTVVLSTAMAAPALARGKRPEAEGKNPVNKQSKVQSERRGKGLGQRTTSKKAKAAMSAVALGAAINAEATGQRSTEAMNEARRTTQRAANNYKYGQRETVESSFRESMEGVLRANMMVKNKSGYKLPANGNKEVKFENQKIEMVEAATQAQNALIAALKNAKDQGEAGQLALGIAILGKTPEFLELNRVEDLQTIERFTQIARSLQSNIGSRTPYTAAMREYARATNQKFEVVERETKENCK